MRRYGFGIALIAACSGSSAGDNGGNTTAPDGGGAGSPFEGRWTGMTDDGGPITFEISGDGRLVSLEIELEISIGTGRCTGTFGVAPNAAVSNGRFNLTATTFQNAGGTVQGALDATLSGMNGTGNYDIDSFAFICGGSLSVGTGGPSGTFTVSNQGGTVTTRDGGTSTGGDGGTPSPGVGTWTNVSSTNAPTARSNPAAVWTGAELIIWGGYDGAHVGDGARYNPSSDSWTAMSSAGAPSARSSPATVWTGTEMIVWGAGNAQTADGARYNPANDTWAPISTTAAPSRRFISTAAWTGTEMIIWGGYDGDPVNTGARYNPANDTWTPISANGAPSGRNGHALIWTGSEVIVFGGNAGNMRPSDAARYNPSSDTWTPVTMTGAPIGRSGIEDAVIWSGTEMIVWGGWDGAGAIPGGAKYDPAQDRWTPLSTNDTPRARTSHTAVWSGDKMIVWGGATTNMANVSLATGGLYDPATDGWTATASEAAPEARNQHVAVWIGTGMIIFGGTNGTTRFGGARYAP